MLRFTAIDNSLRRGRGKVRVAVIAFALSTICQAALAGPLEECVLSSPSLLIVRSCTQIIADPSFGSEQKALAYKNRAVVRLSAGAVELAISDFSDSIRLKKDDPVGFAGRGWAEFTRRQFSQSIRDYGEAIRLAPANAHLYLERGHIHIAAGKPEEGIRDLTQAIRLDPSNDQAFNARGLAYYRKGDFGHAQEDYSAAIKINPLVAVYYVNRGYLYETQNKRKEAIDDFVRALQFDPSLSVAMNALSRLQPGGGTQSQTEQLIRKGRQVAVKDCSHCHAIGNTDTSPDKKAPEFRNLSRLHQDLTLRAPVERAMAVTHDIMPPFNLASEEIEALIAYISSFVAR